MPDLFWVLDLAWKSTFIAALALLLLRVARDRSAAQRSFLAHAGLFAIAALPLATMALPVWSPLPAARYPLPELTASVVYEQAVVAAPALPTVANDGTWLAPWLYLPPVVLLLTGLLAAIARLWAMRHRAVVLVDAPWLAALALAQRRMGFKHGTALLVSDELRSPISWGVLRPTIVLDPGAVAATVEAEAIIAHELAHVARWDWAKLLLARLTCALFWFNPLVWLLARESHQLREEAADDAVLLADVAGADYAALLVNAARHDNAGVLLAAHGVAPGRGSLKRRVARVLDGGLSRAPVGAGVGALGLLLIAGVAAPLAAFGPGAPLLAEAAPATLAAIETMPSAAVPATPPAAPALPPRPIRAAAAARPVVAAPAPAPAPLPERAAAPAGHGAFGPVSLDDIVAARALGIDPLCVRDFAAIFPGVRLRDIVAARAVGVTADYARFVRRRYPTATLRDVVKMRAVGATTDDLARWSGPRSATVEIGGPRGDVVEVSAGDRAIARVSGRGRASFAEADPPEPPDDD